MTVFVALLRAVNLGPKNRLSMAALRRLCEEAGFTDVKTYIASGNVVFQSRMDERGVKAALEKRLRALSGKPVAVLVRSAAEMARVAAANPLDDEDASRSVAIFLDAPADPKALDQASGRKDEKVVLHGREIFVLYPHGIGRSKLKIPAAADGTARNMNSVARLAQMAAAL